MNGSRRAFASRASANTNGVSSSGEESLAIPRIRITRTLRVSLRLPAVRISNRPAVSPQTSDTYPPQTCDTPQAYHDTPQTCGGDYGAGGVSAGLSTYFMDLGNQNQSALTFDVWPVTTEVFVDGV